MVSNALSSMELVSNDNFIFPDTFDGNQATRDFPASGPQFAELFCDFRDGGAAGFALAQVPPRGRVLWVQERIVSLETGRPFGRGGERFGCAMDRLLLACARNVRDLLWTMEEGLRCNSITAIIGEIRGNPKALDFTASKRLAMRAERQGVSVFLLRYSALADLSAARRRWTVRSAPSAQQPYDTKAPGAPRWHTELFRARDIRPGTWTVEYDRTSHRLHLVPVFSDPALDQKMRRSFAIAGK